MTSTSKGRVDGRGRDLFWIYWKSHHNTVIALRPWILEAGDDFEDGSIPRNDSFQRKSALTWPVASVCYSGVYSGTH